MNKDSIWFQNDFKPSTYQWTLANKHFGTDLYHQDSQTFIFIPSQPVDHTSSFSEISTSQEILSQNISTPTKKQTSEINNYQKNICSYISKRIVQDLIHPKSQKFVRKLCLKTKCKFQDAIEYYTKRSKEIFGINHLTMMITPQNQQQINIKKMFCVYLNWFLRNKYMFYMLKYGKMEEKEKYLQFKNKYLLYVVKVESQFQKYL